MEALVRDGRVLLCHRVPQKADNPDRWDFPGGHVEAGESDGEALARELQEEVGVAIEPSSRRWDLEVRRDTGEAAVRIGSAGSPIRRPALAPAALAGHIGEPQPSRHNRPGRRRRHAAPVRYRFVT